MEERIIEYFNEVNNTEYSSLDSIKQEYSDEEILDAYLKYEGISGYTRQLLSVIKCIKNFAKKESSVRIEGNYILGTAHNIAEYITKDIEYVKNNQISSAIFHNCDFALVHFCDIEQKSLEEIYYEASSWYGIKKVDTGFNSRNIDIVADYYGGNALCADYIEDFSQAVNVVEQLILNAINRSEICDAEDLLIGEILN